MNRGRRAQGLDPLEDRTAGLIEFSVIAPFRTELSAA